MTQRYTSNQFSVEHKARQYEALFSAVKKLESLASKQNGYWYGFFRYFLQVTANVTVTMLSLVHLRLNRPYVKTIYTTIFTVQATAKAYIHTHWEMVH